MHTAHLAAPVRVCAVKACGAAQGDTEEETGCPPLFEFASPDDAEALDLIADAVLSPEDDPDGARCVPRARGVEGFKGLIFYNFRWVKGEGFARVCWTRGAPIGCWGAMQCRGLAAC